MDYGFYLANSGPTARPENLASIARKGEELGFHSMVVGDHVIVPRHIASPYPYTVGGEFPGAATGEYLEQLTLLTYLAGVTERIRLVPSVMILPHRNPVLTAKILATIDVLSHGRLTVGVGVGWMEEEFEALGLPPFAERGAVSDEYIRAFKELWTSDDPSFEGEYCRFSDITFLPKPVQKPHPPIWVGGQTRRAIRRAAELGDGWHPVGATPAAPLEPEDLAEDMRLMARYAERVGRDPSEIEVAMKAPLYDSARSAGGERRRFTGEPEQIASDVRTYRDIGVSHLIFDVRSGDTNETLERMEWFSEDVVAQV
jgi:probable F420-dependent oxidoreductase